MRRSSAKLFVLLISLVLGVATGAHVDFAHAAATGKRVAVFMGPTQDKYLGALSKSFETTATAAGMKVSVFSSPFDPALQAQQIDDAIAQKYDMLVVQTISQKAVIPPLTRAKAAHIPVVLVVVPLEGDATKDLYLTYAGYDDVRMGQIAGDAMVKALKDSGRSQAKIAIVAGSMDEGKAPLREKAFRAEIAKQPGFEVVTTEDVQWDPVKAEKASGQLLARYAAKGGLDGIYGMNDSLANGAVLAADSAGLTAGTAKGNLIIVGGNCQAPGIHDIQTGRMAATVQMFPVEEGKLAAEQVKNYFDGKPPTSKAVFIPTNVVTKANLATAAQPCSY